MRVIWFQQRTRNAPTAGMNQSDTFPDVEYNSVPSMTDVDIKSFRSAFHGQIFEPADVGYDEARQIWKASVSKHPGVIARCSGLADVIAAINFGRASNQPKAIRGGGHNVGGRALCDDGLVIDLSRMRSVFVDYATRRVRVQGGATLGDVDRETHSHSTHHGSTECYG